MSFFLEREGPFCCCPSSSSSSSSGFWLLLLSKKITSLDGAVRRRRRRRRVRLVGSAGEKGAPTFEKGPLLRSRPDPTSPSKGLAPLAEKGLLPMLLLLREAKCAGRSMEEKGGTLHASIATLVESEAEAVTLPLLSLSPLHERRLRGRRRRRRRRETDEGRREERPVVGIVRSVRSLARSFEGRISGVVPGCVVRGCVFLVVLLTHTGGGRGGASRCPCTWWWYLLLGFYRRCRPPPPPLCTGEGDGGIFRRVSARHRC